MKVITELPIGSDSPALLLDIYSWGREPRGEYYYYFAADAGVIADGKINATLAPHSFVEAYVSFENDALNVARTMRDHIVNSAYGTVRDGVSFLEPMLDRSLSAWSNFESKHILGALSFDDISASWFDFSHWGQPAIALEFVKVDRDRVTAIRGVTTTPESTLRPLYDRWLTLIKTYKDIPYRLFTGAVRM